MTRRICLGALVALLTASTLGSTASPPDALASPPTPLQPDSEPVDQPIFAASAVGMPLSADVPTAEGGGVVVDAAPPPDPPPEPEPPAPAPVVLTVRERALLKLLDLGAPGWVIRGFECIGWAESGWQPIRSAYQNYDGSYDHGPLQFNDVHWPRLNRLGLDPYVPEDAAVYAWTLWREQGFGPWAATRGKCGV